MMPRNKKRYIYALQKGGATKTEKCFNFGVASNIRGQKTLIVDADAGQGNITQALGYNKDTLHHSFYSLITGASTPEETILETYYDPRSGIFFDPTNSARMSELGLNSLEEARRGPDLLPMSTIHCKDKEYELIQNGMWGALLKTVLDEIDENYDEMHIDTSPKIDNVFSEMAILAATTVVIPLVPESRFVDGLSDLAQWVIKARVNNRSLMVAGLIFSRVYYSHHTDMIKKVKTEILPRINLMTENTRKRDAKSEKLLAGLSFECFEKMDSESKIYGEDLSKRANIISAPLRRKKSEIYPVAEVWAEYIELLKRSGEDYGNAALIYNTILKAYFEAENNEKRELERRKVGERS